MPFPDLINMGFTAKEDSKFFDETPVDPALRKEFEGGFVSTRPRFTRAPPILITTGFTDISDLDKELIYELYNLVRGGSGPIGYTHPVSAELFTVRIVRPIKAKYAGIGGFHRWDIASIELETI